MRKLNYLETLAKKIIIEYDYLIYLSISNKENTEIYNKHLKILKELYNKEQKTLQNLLDGEVNYYIDVLDGLSTIDIDPVLTRLYDNISFIYESRNAKDFENKKDINAQNTLSDYFTAYIYKKTLKKLEEIIKNDTLELKKINSKTYNEMYKYFKKYTILLIRTNIFLEKLALHYNFDLEKMNAIQLPSYDIQDNIYNSCIYKIIDISKKNKIENNVKYMLEDFFDLLEFEEKLKLLNNEQLENLKSYSELLSYESKSQLLETYILKLEEY